MLNYVPIDTAATFDVVVHDPDTGSVADADSAPVYDVFEDITDTPILSAQTMTKRTSKTGNYRGTFTCSAANGFEADKSYNVVVSATKTGSVSASAITAKKVALTFRAGLAVSVAGVPPVDVADWKGAPAPAMTGDSFARLGAPTGASIAADVAAVNSKTTNLPASPAAVGSAMTLTSGERDSVADALLNRDMSTGTDTGSTTVRTVRQALRFLRNKWTISGGTLSVKKENDSTESWSATVTQTAGDPVSTVDPA